MFCIIISLLEALKVYIAYPGQCLAHLVESGTVLLHPVRPYYYLYLLEIRHTKRIPAIRNATHLWNFQKKKQIRFEQCHTIPLQFLPIRFKTTEAQQIRIRAPKSTTLCDYSEDCCTSKFLERDYSADADHRQKISNH